MFDPRQQADRRPDAEDAEFLAGALPERVGGLALDINAGVCMPRCAGVVGEVEHRGDSGIEGSEGIDEGARIGVFRSILDRQGVAQTQVDGKLDVWQHSP